MTQQQIDNVINESIEFVELVEEGHRDFPSYPPVLPTPVLLSLSPDERFVCCQAQRYVAAITERLI